MKKLFIAVLLTLMTSAVFSQAPKKEPKISTNRLKMYAYSAISINNHQMMDLYAKDTSAHAQKLAKISYERYRYYAQLSSLYANKITKKNDTGNDIVF